MKAKATKKIPATDSQLRAWLVWRDKDGDIILEPVGHATDPDSADLSVEDERMLLDLAPAMPDEGEDDHIGLAYDRARDRLEDERLAA